MASDLDDRRATPQLQELKNDGSTASGCWIYCGVYPQEHQNRANQRESEVICGHGWGFSWPNDMSHPLQPVPPRVPTASHGASARSWSGGTRRRREWTGLDVPDFKKEQAAGLPTQARRRERHGRHRRRQARSPCIPTASAWLFVTSGLKDGPLPTHYEPLESLIRKSAVSRARHQSRGRSQERPDNPYAQFADDPRFPYVLRPIV